MIRKIVTIKVISWKITEEHRWFLNPSFTINRTKFLVNKKLSIKELSTFFTFKFLNTNLLKKSNFENVFFFFFQQFKDRRSSNFYLFAYHFFFIDPIKSAITYRVMLHPTCTISSLNANGNATSVQNVIFPTGVSQNASVSRNFIPVTLGARFTTTTASL